MALDPNEVKSFFDYREGALYWKISPSQNTSAGKRAGCFNKLSGYREVMFRYHTYKEHRLIWAFMFKEWPRGEIDHIDQDKTNNNISNLRDTSHATNQLNIPAIGVKKRPFKERWQARIRASYKYKTLGDYDSFEEACCVYESARLKALAIEVNRAERDMYPELFSRI